MEEVLIRQLVTVYAQRRLWAKFVKLHQTVQVIQLALMVGFTIGLLVHAIALLSLKGLCVNLQLHALLKKAVFIVQYCINLQKFFNYYFLGINLM
jgi:hypothetical protein